MHSTSQIASRLSIHIAAVAALTVALAASLVHADEHIYQQALKSTLMVTVPGEKADTVEMGTGALVDLVHGYAVTAAHVVQGHDEATVYIAANDDQGHLITSTPWYFQRADTIGIQAKIIGRDASTDVAVLKLKSVPLALTPMALAPASGTPGQKVFAIGNSGMDADDALWCYRDGSIRQACHKKIDDVVADMIETTIASNHGDSGGPVMNEQGQLIGITHSHHSESVQNDIGQHIGYCIDVSEIRKLLPVDFTPPTSFALLPLSKPWENSNAVTPFNLHNFNLPADPTPAPKVDPAVSIVRASVDEFPAFLGSVDDNTISTSVALTSHGCQNRECEMVVTLADADGEAVHDADGRLLQQLVAFTPGYDKTIYDRDKVLIANFVRGDVHDALNDSRHRYGFLVSVRDVHTHEWITASGRFIPFNEAVARQNNTPSEDPYAYRGR